MKPTGGVEFGKTITESGRNKTGVTGRGIRKIVLGRKKKKILAP